MERRKSQESEGKHLDEKGPRKFELRVSLRLSENHETQEEQLGKSKSVHWRHKMKQNPKKYEAFKKFDAIRAQIRRDELKTELHNPGNVELLKLYRAKKAEKMQEFRARKKREKEEEERKNGKKPKTRAQIEKGKARKAKDAARKRRERAKMPKKKKRQISAKRREQRRREKERLSLVLEHEEQERKEKEEEHLRQEIKHLQDKLAKQEQAKQTAATCRSKVAKRQSLGRARKAISQQPAVYADTVEDLITKASPRKKEVLERRGILKTTDINNIITQGLAAQLHKLSKRRSKKDQQLKRALAPALKITKKYRCQRRTFKKFKITEKLLKDPATKGPHKRALSDTTTKLVTNFYNQHSVTLPDKKLVSKKTKLPARFLTQTIADLLTEFRKAHPTAYISMSKFAALRPRNVKLRGAIKYRGCLCEYCANVELKITALNNLSHQHNMPSIFTSIYDFNSSTLCPKGSNKYHKLECINRQCCECGVAQMTSKIQPLLDIHTGAVKWKKWEKEALSSEGDQTQSKGKKKVLKQQEGTLEKLLEELQEETVTKFNLALHLFTASWQGDQFRRVSENPPEGCIVMVLDFAENYSCRFQDEIQSVHWGHASATLHPIVAYYRCPRCGEKTIDSLIMISDDNTHDHHAVHKFSEVAINHLKKKTDCKRIVRFSDGCGSQYKSRGPFMDVSYGKQDYGVQFQHEFFGSRHGKGPSDGESGVIKHQATEAVMAGNAIIANAHDLYLYVKEHCTRPAPTEANEDKCNHFQRTVFWVSDLDRARDRQATKTVDNTRLFHSVVSIEPNIIAVRKLSCFCDPCLQNDGECVNAAYVDLYVCKDVRTGKTTVFPEDNSEEETQSEKLMPTRQSQQPPPVTNPGDPEDPPKADTCSKQDTSFNPEDFVAVRLVSKKKTHMYIAKVLAIESHDVRVRFLQSASPSSRFYTWSDEKPSWQSSEDIFRKLSPPELLQGRGIKMQFNTTELAQCVSLL